MDQLERQKKIVEYLRVKPISHGQIYTFQIAIPDSELKEIAHERFEVLRNNLAQQSTNLIPLIVRRTDKYTEEEEYEVVYGADWCIVAREIDIEKLWVWVFDMTDDEAEAARKEMEQLIGSHSPPVPDSVKQVEVLLKRFDESINKKIDGKLGELLNKITMLSEKIDKIPIPQPPPDKLNLSSASESEIRSALIEAGVKERYAEATLKAIRYWKAPGKKLTWANLKQSTTGKSDFNIKDFGDSAFRKLKEIAKIE